MLELCRAMVKAMEEVDVFSLGNVWWKELFKVLVEKAHVESVPPIRHRRDYSPRVPHRPDSCPPTEGGIAN